MGRKWIKNDSNRRTRQDCTAEMRERERHSGNCSCKDRKGGEIRISDYRWHCDFYGFWYLVINKTN
jgi:hypothetical protein